MAQHQYISFFDENKDNFSLWQKYFSSISSINLRNDEILLEGTLYKHGKLFPQFLVERYYVLYKNCLVYYKNQKKTAVKGILKLNGVKLEKIIDSQTKLEGFKLIKNNCSIQLFSKKEPVNQQWIEQLRKICININFHERYHTTKLIGKGGFAKVYQAERISDKKIVAVKALSKNKMNSQGNGKEALQNELLITSMLKHDNIIQLEEVYESPTSVYIILELLSGGELINLINTEQSITEKQIKQIMETLLKTLVYIHSQGIMHRDLKPDNLILISKDKQLDFKIVDFGLSAFVDEPVRIFKKCGTPGFVAPEIFTTPHGKYDTKCDIFSAGCILHQLFTGKVPFDCKIEDMLENNRKALVCIQQDKISNISQNAKDLLKQMLEINPKVRPSAKELLKHPFFITSDSIQENCKIPIKMENQIHGFLKKFKIRQQELADLLSSQTNGQQNELESNFEIRVPVINGHTSTIADSRRFSESPDSQCLRILHSRVAPLSQFSKASNDDINNINQKINFQLNENKQHQEDSEKQQKKQKMNAVNGASDIYKYTLLKKAQDKDLPNQINFKKDKLLNPQLNVKRRQSDNIPQTQTIILNQTNLTEQNYSFSEYENIHLASSEESPLSQNIRSLNNQSTMNKLLGFSVQSKINSKKQYDINKILCDSSYQVHQYSENPIHIKNSINRKQFQNTL